MSDAKAAREFTEDEQTSDFLPSALLCSASCSAVSDSLQLHRQYNPWNSPGQNTGVGSLPLLQGIFPTQRLPRDGGAWWAAVYRVAELDTTEVT